MALRNFCAGPLLILAWGENLTLWVDDQQLAAVGSGDDCAILGYIKIADALININGLHLANNPLVFHLNKD